MSGRAASARAFAGEKDELESAGTLEVGELITVKAIDLNAWIENRFAALESLDQDGLLSVKTMDLNSYIENRISELLSHDPATVAPGALMKPTPKTFTPPKAAFTFTSSAPASLLAMMKTTPFSDLTKWQTSTNVSTAEKSPPVVRFSTKRIKATTSTKGTTSVRTTQQQELSSSPPLSSKESPEKISLSYLIASTLPGAKPAPHVPDPNKGWPTSCAPEPMMPATKNRKSRFYPTSTSTTVKTAAPATALSPITDTAGWTTVTNPKTPALKRHSAPAALKLAPLPAILLEDAPASDDESAPLAMRLYMPVPQKPVGDMSCLRIKTGVFVCAGWGEVGAEVSQDANTVGGKGGEGMVGGGSDEGWGSGEWEGEGEEYWV